MRRAPRNGNWDSPLFLVTSFRLVEAQDLPHLRWSKPGSFAGAESGNAWSLSLDLVSAGNRHCGRLTIYRCYTSRDLQLDINLLTSAFAATLADAVQRTAVQNVEFIPAAQDAAILAAQAG